MKRASLLVLALLVGCTPAGTDDTDEADANRDTAAAEPRVAGPVDRTPSDSLLPCTPIDVLPAQDPDRITEDVRGVRRWSCVISPDLPGREVVLEGDDENFIVRVDLGTGDTADFGIGGIEPPYRDAAYLGTQDFDGDGYRDLQLLYVWGVTGNRGYLVWRYDPSSARLVEDRALSELGNPQPIAAGRCVLTRGTGGAAGQIFYEEILCWRDGQLVSVERVEQDYDDAAAVFIRHTWREAVGVDTLVLVATDTVRTN